MKSVPGNIQLSKDLSHQFTRRTIVLALHPELPSGHVPGQQLQQHRSQSPERQTANALGKHQFVVDKAPLIVINLTIIWEAFNDHFIPRCQDGSFLVLKVLLIGHSMCYNWTGSLIVKDLWTPVFCPGKYSLLLRLPISRVPLLQSLIVYKTICFINHCKSPSHHYFH